MKKVMFFVLIASLSLVLAAPAFSATLCVDPTDPTCYATIQEAVDAAAPGDIIQIRVGRYDENVEIYTPGVTLIGVDVTVSRVKGIGTMTVPAGPGKVVIDALDGCMANGGGSIGTQQAGYAGIYIEADDVTVKNLTVRHSCEWNIHSVGNNTTVDNCRLLDGTGGVYIDSEWMLSSAQENGVSATLQNSEIAGNGPAGGVWIMSGNAYVFNNKILNNFNIGALVDGEDSQILSNEVHSVGGSVGDLVTTQLPMPDVHGVCISVKSGEDVTVIDNNISNCALIGILVDNADDFFVNNNTINSTLVGILNCSSMDGIMDNNTINGVLAGLVSFPYGLSSSGVEGSQADAFVNSLLGGTLAQDLPTYVDMFRQQAAVITPSENGFDETYSNNSVKNAIVVGYLIFGYYIGIEDNRSENVQSTLIADYLGDDQCGFWIDAGEAEIVRNYSADSSTGFHLDLWSYSFVSENVAQSHTFNGFYVDLNSGYHMFQDNTARYNGGNEFWTGGFDIASTGYSYSMIEGNLAEGNVNGFLLFNANMVNGFSTSVNGCDFVVNENTAQFNRADGMEFNGSGLLPDSNGSTCTDATANTSINNDGDGIVNNGANFGLFTGNVATGDRKDICKACGTGTFPAEPPVGNTYDTWDPMACSFDAWRYCGPAP